MLLGGPEHPHPAACPLWSCPHAYVFFTCSCRFVSIFLSLLSSLGLCLFLGGEASPAPVDPTFKTHPVDGLRGPTAAETFSVPSIWITLKRDSSQFEAIQIGVFEVGRDCGMGSRMEEGTRPVGPLVLGSGWIRRRCTARRANHNSSPCTRNDIKLNRGKKKAAFRMTSSENRCFFFVFFEIRSFFTKLTFGEVFWGPTTATFGLFGNEHRSLSSAYKRIHTQVTRGYWSFIIMIVRKS